MQRFFIDEQNSFALKHTNITSIVLIINRIEIFQQALSKANYHIQTDAVQRHILPEKNYTKDKEWLIYAEEADLLNVALFSSTAKDWRELNPEQAKKDLNIRDFASINELAVLSNIESYNAELIKKGVEKTDRFLQLREMAVYQLEILDKKDALKAMKKLADDIYIEQKKTLNK